MAARKSDPSGGKIQDFDRRFVDRDKGPIKLRTRERANGCFVIYLDTYIGDAKHKCEAVNVNNQPLYLVPENGRNDSVNKTRNNKTWEQAKAIKAQRIIDRQNGELGFSQTAERQNADVLKYIGNLRDEQRAARSRGEHLPDHFAMLYAHFQVFTKGEKVTFGQIDRDFQLRFIDYLKTEAVCTNIRHKERRPLSPNSQIHVMKRLSVVLSRAVKDKIIEYNPFQRLTQDEKLKKPQSHIAYLTIEEVQRLINTPCKWDIMKRAFLFSCSTGLRYSDVSALTWGDIRDDDFYNKVMIITVKKTRRQEVFPIPTPALHFLPERNGAADNEIIFPLKYDNDLGRKLQKWAESAGINKKVRFHVSRHTAATMNLALGADIATVSKLLGHSDITTTQIYAEVINESKKKAVALQDNVFTF